VYVSTAEMLVAVTGCADKLQLAHPFCINNLVIQDVDNCCDWMCFHPKPAECPTQEAGDECQAKQTPDSHDGGLDRPAEKNIKNVHVASQKA
jgi:hypothetical protein